MAIGRSITPERLIKLSGAVSPDAIHIWDRSHIDLLNELTLSGHYLMALLMTSVNNQPGLSLSLSGDGAH
jgi:hypothetical protein